MIPSHSRIDSKKLMRLISSRTGAPGTTFKIGDLVKSIQSRHPEYSRTTIYSYCTMLCTTGYLCRLYHGMYGVLRPITITGDKLRKLNSETWTNKHVIVDRSTITAVIDKAFTLVSQVQPTDGFLTWGSTAEWYGIWDLEAKSALLLGRISDLGVITPAGYPLNTLWLTTPLSTGILTLPS